MRRILHASAPAALSPAVKRMFARLNATGRAVRTTGRPFELRLHAIPQAHRGVTSWLAKDNFGRLADTNLVVSASSAGATSAFVPASNEARCLRLRFSTFREAKRACLATPACAGITKDGGMACEEADESISEKE